MSWCPYRYTEEEMAAIREAKMDMEQELWSKEKGVPYTVQKVDISSGIETEEQRRQVFRAARAAFWAAGLRKRPMPAYDYNYTDDAGQPWDKPHATLKKAEAAIQTAVAEQIGMQTAQHLSALDAALGKAVEACQRVGGWTLRRCGAGGWDIFHETGLYLHIRDQTMAEMIHAVLSGDLLTALQRRDAVYEALPVAP